MTYATNPRNMLPNGLTLLQQNPDCAARLDCAANIQVIPQRLNIWKKNRMLLTEPGEWIRMA